MRFFNEKEARDFLGKCHAFSSSVIRFSKSGFEKISQDELCYRESICRSCDEWDAAALNNTGRCKKCGCSTWAKLRMATERCPIGKWVAMSAKDSK